MEKRCSLFSVPLRCGDRESVESFVLHGTVDHFEGVPGDPEGDEGFEPKELIPQPRVFRVARALGLA